jgi:hypothetical protein
VEERSRDCRLVHLQAGEDLRDSPRVVDELLPGAAHLPVVGLGGESERADDQVAIDGRITCPFRGLQLGKKIVDEILMPFDNRHRLILPGPDNVPSPDWSTRTRNGRPGGEPRWSMFRRRRTAYKIRLAARLLLALGREPRLL